MDTKKILIALAVSVALNCFFVGFEVSRLTCPHSPDSLYPQRKEASFERGFFKHSHKAFGKAFFKMSKEDRKKMFDFRKKIKDAGKEIKKELLAENFDEARFNEALEKASEVRQEVDREMREMFLKTVKTMTPEERRNFAESFEKRHYRKHKRDMKPCHKKDRPCPFAKRHFKDRDDDFPKHRKQMRRFSKTDNRPCAKKGVSLPEQKPENFDENASVAPVVQEPDFFHKEVVVVQEIIPEENVVLTEQERLMRAEQDKMREKKRMEYRKMREKKRAKRRAFLKKLLEEGMSEEEYMQQIKEEERTERIKEEEFMKQE